MRQCWEAFIPNNSLMTLVPERRAAQTGQHVTHHPREITENVNVIMEMTNLGKYNKIDTFVHGKNGVRNSPLLPVPL